MTHSNRMFQSIRKEYGSQPQNAPAMPAPTSLASLLDSFPVNVTSELTAVLPCALVCHHRRASIAPSSHPLASLQYVSPSSRGDAHRRYLTISESFKTLGDTIARGAVNDGNSIKLGIAFSDASATMKDIGELVARQPTNDEM